AVVLGGDEDDVVGALAGDGKTGQVKRLGIDLAVYPEVEEQAETVHVDVGRRQDGLAGIEAGPRVVVVVGQHADRGQGAVFQRFEPEARRGETRADRAAEEAGQVPTHATTPRSGWMGNVRG